MFLEGAQDNWVTSLRPRRTTHRLSLARGAIKAAMLTIATISEEQDIATIHAHLNGLRDGLRDALDAIGER